MLGFTHKEEKPRESLMGDLGKLFFDSFSGRVSSVEQAVKKLMLEVDDLKVSRDRSQLSDLVLLERLQKMEGVLAESLLWIKKVASVVESSRQRLIESQQQIERPLAQAVSQQPTEPLGVRSVVLPGGEIGSLSTMTTATELQVLALLFEQGPKSAPEIGHAVGRSREHSARLMKKLFQEGYVKRDQTRIPFRYSLVDRIRASFEKPEVKPENAREETAAVQA